jgi:hypothetical protein
VSNCCQYATNDSKVCVGLTFISIKEAQIHFVKYYHMDQKEWEGMTRMAQGMHRFQCAPT